MKRVATWGAALILGACASSAELSPSASQGCLFWSTGCTRLESAPETPPLEPAAPRPAVDGPFNVPPAGTASDLPEELGRLRATRQPYARDREAEAAFDARFAAEKRGTPADTVYPLPANCTSPPSTLLRNSPAGRFAPGRNSAAATAYARAYDRCGRPGTWPRP